MSVLLVFKSSAYKKEWDELDSDGEQLLLLLLLPFGFAVLLVEWSLPPACVI